MGKIRFYYPSSKAKRVKRLGVSVTLQQIHGGFEACATFGRKSGGRRGPAKSHDERSQCGVGKNPRKAIKQALNRLGDTVGGRTGAFAGLGRKRR